MCSSALVCPGHGWAFSASGQALKRNEHGRADPKGTIDAWVIERDGAAFSIGRRVTTLPSGRDASEADAGEAS